MLPKAEQKGSWFCKSEIFKTKANCSTTDFADNIFNKRTEYVCETVANTEASR